MSLKANKKLIGGFVVGAIALAVTAVILLGGGEFFARKSFFVMYFEGSVQGLNVGAPVLLKGVKVGAVTEIRLLFDLDTRKFHTQVFAETYDKIYAIRPGGDVLSAKDAFQGDADTEKRKILKELVEKDGLRAQLAQQSFVTGQLLVNLDFFPKSKLRYVHYGTGNTRQLPTVASSMEELSRTLRDIPFDEMARNIKGIVEGIDRLVNSKELKGTLSSLDTAMEEIKEFTGKLNSRSDPMANKVEEMIEEVKKLVKNINEQVDPLARSLDATLQDARGLVGNVNRQVDPVSEKLQETLRAAQASLQEADILLSTLNHGAPEDSAAAYEIATALKSFSVAMQSVRDLAAYLERHPEALLSGKE